MWVAAAGGIYNLFPIKKGLLQNLQQALQYYSAGSLTGSVGSGSVGAGSVGLGSVGAGSVGLGSVG